MKVRAAEIVAIMGILLIMGIPSCASSGLANPSSVSGLASAFTLVGNSSWRHLSAELAFRVPPGGEIEIGAARVDGVLYVVESAYNSVGSVQIDEGNEVSRRELDGASVHGQANASGARVLFVFRPDPENAQSLRLTEGLTDLQPTGTRWRVFPEPAPKTSREPTTSRHTSFSTDGPRLSANGPNSFSYGGHMEAFVWGVDLTVYGPGGEQFVVHTGRTESGEPLPPNRGVERIAHFVGDVRGLGAVAADVPWLWLSEGWAELQGAEIFVEHLEGGIRSEGESRKIADDSLRLVDASGLVRVAAPQREGHQMIPFSFEGSFSAAYVAGLPWDPSGPWTLPDAATTAAGVVFVVVIGLAAVRVLQALAALHLFSRRTRVEGWDAFVGRTLQNRRRRITYELVLSRPGIQPFHVWKALGGAFGNTLRSLERLEAVGFVRSIKIGGFRHYFPKPQGNEPLDPLVAFLARRTVRETLEFLKEHAPVSLAETSRGLGVAPATAHDRLQRLVASGLAERFRTNQGIRFRILEAMSLPVLTHPQPSRAPVPTP